MGDVLCSKCGEPWDSYSLQPGIYNSDAGDLTREEALGLRAGKGCPSCGMGKWCPICLGTGIDTGCRTCSGRCLVLAWRAPRTTRGYVAGHWYLGYSDERGSPARCLGENVEAFRAGDGHGSADGFVQERWTFCPDCGPRTELQPHCLTCSGTGKPRGGEELEFEAARSEVENSDEEPIGILIRRGVL